MSSEDAIWLAVAFDVCVGVSVLIWMAAGEYELAKMNRERLEREAERPRKRLVKTPRRTYANPVPEGSIPIGPNMHVVPFTEAELKFLRSLGEKEQQDE